MIDAKKLLDQFLGAGTGSSGLQNTIGSVLGQLGQSGAGQSADGTKPSPWQKPQSAGDIARTAQGYLSGNTGSLATGAIAGGLLGLLLGSKSGRKLGKSALKLGGLAAVGALAYKAWQDYQGGKAAPHGAAPTPTGGPILLPPPASSGFGTDAVAMVAIEAMIAAAKADGHIDDRERARIMGELAPMGSDDETRRFLETELAKPIDIDALAARATTPEIGSQIYAASLLAIDPDTDVERAYLASLAEKLRLDPALKAHLEDAVSQARQGA